MWGGYSLPGKLKDAYEDYEKVWTVKWNLREEAVKRCVSGQKASTVKTAA